MPQYALMVSGLKPFYDNSMILPSKKGHNTDMSELHSHLIVSSKDPNTAVMIGKELFERL